MDHPMLDSALQQIVDIENENRFRVHKKDPTSVHRKTTQTRMLNRLDSGLGSVLDQTDVV